MPAATAKYTFSPSKHVSDDDCAQIKVYLGSLLSRSASLELDADFAGEVNEGLSEVLSVNKPYTASVSSEDLANISVDLRRSGKVDKAQFIAAVAAVGAADHLDDEQKPIAERWLLLCVGAFCRLYINKKDRSSAMAGLRDLRLIVERDPAILALLPVIAMPTTIPKEDRTRMAEAGRTSILALIADAYSLPDPRSVKRSKRVSTGKPKSHWEGDASDLYDDADVEIYSFQTSKLLRRIRKTGVADVEARLDAVHSSVTASVVDAAVPSSIAKVQSGSKVSRGGILASRARKASRSPCDPCCLTPRAVSMVVGVAFGESVKGNQAATFTLLSLLLGRDSQFWETCFKAKDASKGLHAALVLDDHQFFLPVDIRTPAPRGDLQWFEVSGEVRIPLPKEMTEPLIDLVESVGDLTQFRALVDDSRAWLRKTTAKKLSAVDLRKVSRFLRFSLANECRDCGPSGDQSDPIDEAMITTILGGALTVPPQILYSRVSQESIDDIFNQYWTHLSHNTTVKFTGLEQRVKATNGSKSYLNHDTVKEHFCRIKRGFTDCSYSLVARLNSFAFYIYEVLALSCAYRAVDERGWSRDTFDLTSGIALINDKMVRGAASSRLVKMPEILRLLLLQWIDCLQWLSKTYSAFDLEIRDAAKSALECREIGQCSSAFLFIIDRGQDGRPNKRSLTNAFVRQLYAADFDVRPNWGRHFIRNRLRGLGVNSALVDSVLGHEFRGALATQRYSVLPMNSLDEVADACNTVLLDLGVVVPQIAFEEDSCQWTDRCDNP